MQRLMLVIGVTGGLGTGKSSVCAMLRELGARTIDADVVAREVIAPGTPGWRAIRRVFGSRVIAAGGAVDRRALAGIVFADHRRLARLNAIVHPRVLRRIRQDIARLRRDEKRPACAQRAGKRGGQARTRRSKRCRVLAVEIPLLVEAGVTRVVDRVVLVEATTRQQVARVRAATGWSTAAIGRRITAQLPLDVKRRVADDVITNSGTRNQTRRQVRALWKRLKAQPK